MTDSKVSFTSRKRRNRRARRVGGIQRYFGGMTAPGANDMIFTSRWEYGQLSSGTTGVISAANIAPTIQSTSEYSVLGTMFNEIKLLRCTIIFTPCINAGGSVTSGRLMVGTNMYANATTHASTPLAATDVQNLARVRFIPVGTNVNTAVQYQMVVPRDLEFSGITQDAPSAPTPFAGSPGAVYIFANHLTVSVSYLVVDIQATWHLRGRQ